MNNMKFIYSFNVNGDLYTNDLISKIMKLKCTYKLYSKLKYVYF